MYGYIYKTTNLIDGKIYIGQKKSDHFLFEKYLGSGKRLREAIDKYGEENFKVELIEDIPNKELMDDREIYWISYYNSTNKDIGYNLSNGGRVNRSLSGDLNPAKRPEVREKISKANKGHHRNLGRKHTPEELKKISLGNKDKIVSEETRYKLHLAALNNPNYGMRGKKVSEETKEKIRLAHLGKSKSSKGYIHITNDLEDKMIPLSEFEIYKSQGWRRGRKKFSLQACLNISQGHKGQVAHNKGKIWINNGTINRTVTLEEFEILKFQGWETGKIKICKH